MVALYLVPPFVLILISLTLFPHAGRDDAHITYWSAYSLANFGDILNYNGVRLEQSSSLLHVLILAGVTKLTGLYPHIYGGIISILCGALSVVYAQRLTSLFASGRWAFIAGVLTAGSVYFAYWTTSGMETTLAALCIITFLFYCVRYIRSPGFNIPPVSLWILTPLVILVRPESPLVLVLVVLAFFAFVSIVNRHLTTDETAVTKALIRKAVYVLILVAAFSLLIFLLRYLYFGMLFPQPVSAKSDGLSIVSMLRGAHYLYRHVFVHPEMVLLVLLAGGAGLRVLYRARDTISGLAISLPILFVAIYFAFILLSGGDWMEGGRFLVPIIPVLAALAVLGVSTITKERFIVLTLSALVLLEVLGLGLFARQGSTSVPVWHSPKVPSDVVIDDFSWFEKMNRVNTRDMQVIAKLDSLVTSLRETRSEAITIMSGQMGMVAYYTASEHFGSVQFVDRFGLTTTHIMSCELTSRFPARPVGRELQLETYFNNREALHTICTMPEPMIIFDIDSEDAERQKLVSQNGYVVVYSQTGDVQGHSILKGRRVRADAFIAVRKDLASLIGMAKAENND